MKNEAVEFALSFLSNLDERSIHDSRFVEDAVAVLLRHEYAVAQLLPLELQEKIDDK